MSDFIGFVESLTPREREVYDLKCAGYMDKQIAAKLGIKQRSAECVVQNIIKKGKAKSLVWGRCMVKKPEVRI